MLTTEQLVEHASSFAVLPDHTALSALEAFYGMGFQDESSGDVEAITGHFYRVANWTVCTDSQGFHSVVEHPSEDEAKCVFNRLNRDYGIWLDDAA